ncbi:diguanylate cyclase [Uliginosibacterium sp. H3]|uniref:Diguanylate cyclase n=1 Tax=Uliginosibacterium silvisoli TaxID=3114758 RepID=A0ABU6JYX5_9RHOO|nr:diguanylate cyclase [Uliginosibacterium sp. H3]
MRKELQDFLILALPALLAGLLAMAFHLPPWLGIPLTALCGFVPPMLRLRQTERALVEQAVNHVEFTRQVVDVIPHPVYVKDADSRYIIVNRAFCEERNLPLEQIVGLTTQEITRNKADSQVSRKEDQAVLAGQVIRKEQHDIHPTHRTERHRLIMKGACRTANGAMVIVGANFDLSHWWVNEQDLQQELQQQRTHYQDTLDFVQRVLDLIPHPVYVKDQNSRYVIANSAMAAESGLSAEELIGSTGDVQGHIRAEDEAVLAGKELMTEVQDVDARGLDRFRIVSKGVCLNAYGEPVIVGAHVDLTELRYVERNLQESLKNEVALRERTEAFIQRLIDVIPDPVFIKKAGGVYVMINEAFASYRNVDKLNFKGFKRHEPSTDPALRAASMSEDEQVLAGMDSDKEDHVIRQATGEEIFRVISKRRSVFVDGDPVIVGIEHHITRWKLAERELKAVLEREMAQRLRTERFVQDLIDVIPDPVYVKSADGQYLIVNDAFARVRRKPREELIGLVSPSTVSRDEDQQVIAGGEVLKEEHRHRSTGEEIFRVVCKRRCVSVDGSPVVVGIDHYITEWRLAERELKRLAEEDVLTGIANRRHFTTEANRSLEKAHRHGEVMSLLLFDLDHFKLINDKYGHNIGDEVLREMARRMQECFRKSDLPGRWGGEEFIALLPHTPVFAARDVAERLRKALADIPISTSSGDIKVTLSGGGAQMLADDTLESLVARADAALYRAKHGGRNRVETSDATGAVATEPDRHETPEASTALAAHRS